MGRYRGHIVEALEVGVYRIPTDELESDGTFEWDATVMVTVEARADGLRGLGYTYSHAAAATLVRGMLGDVVCGSDPMCVTQTWEAMRKAVRNLGTRGIVSSAISAVDMALWDLKAQLLEVPLATLLGPMREAVPLYGSGGFTSLSNEELAGQLRGFVDAGMMRVKMKVGRDPLADPERVRIARDAIGPEVELFVDANGAYSRKQALRLAERFAEHRVTWFEEPVSSDDLAGLRLLRDRAPAGMAIAAGEYGYDHFYFRRMLEAGAVDVLQADATRCKGFTGFMHAEVLAQTHSISLSAHTAPAIHAHLGASLAALIHLEYFHDHARVESMLIGGLPQQREGAYMIDWSRPGHGLFLRHEEAASYAV